MLMGLLSFQEIAQLDMNPLNALRENGRLVAFGFFMCLCSSVGQTFFISLFNGEIRRMFSLTHGDIGTMYAAGTIASAATLMVAGRLVDRVRLSLVVTFVLGGLAAAALGMGLLWSAMVLPVAFFVLRLFGQGLTSHTGMTAMGRYFTATRGRAISLAALGYSAGEAILPSAVIVLLGYLSWQSIWLGISAVVLASLPVALYLLGGKPPTETEGFSTQATAPREHWRLGEALTERGFWFRMPTLISPAFILTGFFFHQVHLAGEKGWPLPLIAGSFTGYAVSSIVTGLLSGPLVDRCSARKVWPWILLPMMAGCMVLWAFNASWIAPLFMILFGISTGLYGIASTAIWPELYGTRHLGAIKAFVQSVMVLASGLSPALFGLLIDRGIPLEQVALACGLWCLSAGLLAMFTNHSPQRSA
ncbi:MFS transporter [Aestuariivirga sp.]|uniref:MFS transporter n=1 Tax=Aestuariivirga sp. TaxID=2650926 RepID=UPI003918DBDE